MIDVDAFVIAGSSRWNENGLLDITDLAVQGFSPPDLPHTGEIRVVVVLRSEPNEYSTAALRLAVAGPDKKILHAQEHLDSWPSVPAEWGFSTVQLTYTVPFTASQPGTHAIVLFLEDEPQSRAIAPFYVAG